MECWKVLKELDKYSISNYGRIKNNKAGGCRWQFIDNIIPKQNISPLKEGDVPLWQD